MKEQKFTSEKDFRVTNREKGEVRYIGKGGDVVVPPIVDGCVVKELECDERGITALNLTHANKLTWLNCGNNPLTTLDLTHNPFLEWLDCFNTNLTHLDLSQLPELWCLECRHNNLTILDTSHNPALKYLWCTNNHLTTLDTSHNPILLRNEKVWADPNVQVQKTPQRAPEKPSFASAKVAAVGARDAGGRKMNMGGRDMGGKKKQQEQER